MRPIEIGDNGRRAIIALRLTPESAEDLAHQFPPPDLANAELLDAAHDARVALGEADLDE